MTSSRCLFLGKFGTVISPPTTTTLLLRSEEHTSELQSPCNLVCRLLLEKKKQAACHDSQADARTAPVLHIRGLGLWRSVAQAHSTLPVALNRISTDHRTSPLYTVTTSHS